MGDKPEGNAKSICQAYLRGKCHRGRQCRFIHDKGVKEAGRKPSTKKTAPKGKHADSRFDSDDDEDMAATSMRVPGAENLMPPAAQLAKIDPSKDLVTDARKIEAQVSLSAEEKAIRDQERREAAKRNPDLAGVAEEKQRKAEKRKLLAAVPLDGDEGEGIENEGEAVNGSALPELKEKKSVLMVGAPKTKKVPKKLPIMEAAEGANAQRAAQRDRTASDVPNQQRENPNLVAKRAKMQARQEREDEEEAKEAIALTLILTLTVAVTITLPLNRDPNPNPNPGRPATNRMGE